MAQGPLGGDEQSAREAGELDVVMKLYAATLQTDATALSAMIALLATSIGLIGVIAAVFSTSTLPGWAAAFAPLAPIPFMAFGALVAQLSQVRGDLIDEYEAEILRLLKTSRPPAWFPMGRLRRVWLGWYGRTAIGLAFVTLFAGYATVLVTAYVVARDDAPLLAIACLTFCSIATITILGLYVVSLRLDWVVRAWGRSLLRGLALRRSPAAEDEHLG